ncbi:hypothetical protein SRABI106_04317 [Rahnella aquatilis]|nr:hypothetical protein SRABI106_04317 [Rahnella aquatilis]
MHIKDHIAIVCQHILAVFRQAAEFNQFTRNIRARHWDHFHRQREFTQHINLLGSIHDTDEFFGNRGNDFFAGQRSATPFDHLHRAVDFIRAIDIHIQRIHFIAVENMNTQTLQFCGRGIGA